MNQVNQTGKAAAAQSRRYLWLSLAVVLAGSLGLSSLTPGRDQVPEPKKDPTPASSLSAAEISIRGPEQAVVGQRFTLEVFILNSGTTPLKDLEFVAKMDAHLEHESRTREHRVAVEPIAPESLQIVRLTLTPQKQAPAGIDITVRAKNGESDQMRHVLPVVLADPTARPPEKVEGASPLKFKITPLKECFADRPGIFLIHVLNTDTKAMENRLDLVVSYATTSKANQVMHPSGLLGPPGQVPQPIHKEGKMLRMPQSVVPNNPTRQVEVSLPALGPGESRTLPVRLTPRRIGELGIVITPKAAATQVLGSARLQVKFDPTAPTEKLLPVRAGASVPTKLPVNLSDVPEVSIEDPVAKGMQAEEAFEHVSHLIEKINHVNTKKMDAFVETLVASRSDVHGLPFIMGDACRLSAERGQHFLGELGMLRAAMGNPAAMASQLPNPTAQPENESAARARVAALVQVIGPEGQQMGQQMVKYLSTLSHVDATRALAKLAIFSEEDQVRQDAVAALGVRSEKDVNAILLAGLNYPWPAVAQRAADAIVKLKRTDLAPQLVDVLDLPDPRAPQTQEKDGKKVTVVRELVRVNHLRNCLLCHSPGTAATARNVPLGTEGPPVREVEQLDRKGGSRLAVATTLTVPIPLPNQQLPTPSPRGGYGQFTQPETPLVSFDVTYLRQDFSVKLAVADAQPWPEQQRFDFLVRTREITEKEARAYRDLLRPAKDGDLSPYQRTAVASLRLLTGRDAEPTAAAWRSVLDKSKTSEK
jgi:hypothetical protein